MKLGESVSYVVNQDDCIARVGDTWDRCARACGAAELSGVSVVGTSLWSHICDTTTAELYRLLLARAREGHLVGVPYDGSSPDVHREMRLHLRPLHDGDVECTASVIRAETHRPHHPDTSVSSPALETLRVCSWCSRVLVGRRWCDVDDGVATLRLFFKRSRTSISHGMCPRCAKDIGTRGA